MSLQDYRRTPFCNTFQLLCREEMQQQSLAPWRGHSWTAGSDFCMLRQLHDYVIIHYVLYVYKLYIIIICYVLCSKMFSKKTKKRTLLTENMSA